MNKNSASGWLVKAWHNLSSAKILLEVNHYTDVIAVEVHYALEKTLKSFLAYNNEKIPRSHDLDELYSRVNDKITLPEDDIDLLGIASDYHIEESYPAVYRDLPVKEEIIQMIELSEKLLQETCEILSLDIQNIKSK